MNTNFSTCLSTLLNDFREKLDMRARSSVFDDS